MRISLIGRIVTKKQEYDKSWKGFFGYPFCIKWLAFLGRPLKDLFLFEFCNDCERTDVEFYKTPVDTYFETLTQDHSNLSSSVSPSIATSHFHRTWYQATDMIQKYQFHRALGLAPYLALRQYPVWFLLSSRIEGRKRL